MHFIASLLGHMAAGYFLLIHQILKWAAWCFNRREPFKRYALLALRIVQWLLYLLPHILVVGLRYPLAPIAVKYFSTPNKLNLVWWLRWMETPDNPLTGDKGWQTEHIKPGSDPLSDENRTGWMERNGFAWFNFFIIGCIADRIWMALHYVTQNDHWFWFRPDGYWMLRAFIPFADVVIFKGGRPCWTPTERYLNVYWGWSLFGVVDGRHKFTFTTRVKSQRPT